MTLHPGAGVIGCTTAYYLTRHPGFDPAVHSVTLLEAAPSVAPGASGKAGGLLALWAYPPCLVPLSYRLHAELAAEHDGARAWGYRTLGCGSFDAVVSREKLASLRGESAADSSTNAAAADGAKPWEKLPKQNGAATDLLEPGTLPPDLDWVDAEIVRNWAEMGSPGATETAQVHPLHFTTAMANLARDAGVDIRTNAKVTAIKSSRAAASRASSTWTARPERSSPWTP